MASTLIDAPAHQHWLRAEEIRLAEFARHVVRPDGLGAWLDDDGRPDPRLGGHTYITARMAYVSYLAALRGIPGARKRADQLLRGLDTTARDHVHGGWREHDGEASDKSAYTHALVVLAAATATMAGAPIAPRPLAEALEVLDQRFWEPRSGMFADSWTADWSQCRPYRGVNSNMHLVEAMLAAHDATADTTWAERAVSICDFVIEQASANEWRIPEHYDQSWRADLDHNRERPYDQFTPYGATVGHAFEWSRLIVSTAPICEDRSRYISAASELYERASADGWARNGHDGFVYTTDWTGTPVVNTRLHWVVAEAIGAAGTLARVTGESRFVEDYMRWWGYADDVLIDRTRGSWLHELSESNKPAATIWSGKPDLYHAFQATLVGQLPLRTSFAAAIRDNVSIPAVAPRA
ncbi:N-acylglucosamine 2-epimerase [Pseudonocardia sp. Ae717_Ps2]|uniref:AGE family epimerase/isomerase n=1 Tax=Pseudonocardia sp. Ae717_Ps2 TaxID=1885573 RepID=UPI000961EF69|nr:AGE family epimerase/isomerase [Pseudonocardia sp. Ae717_Ps2]OLM28558.1 N-acylglucosamine 2-epimerase [Pseudonocardia sp. Ae717_Ps2]